MGRVMALIRFAPLRAIRSPDPRLEVHLGDTRPGRLAGRAPHPAHPAFCAVDPMRRKVHLVAQPFDAR
jgi:hypothetical protein